MMTEEKSMTQVDDVVATADSKNNTKKKSIRERFRSIWRNITVEPLLLCYIMPSVLSTLAVQNLNLEKACRVNLAYSDIVCDALSRRQTENYTKEEELVQQMVAGMASWKVILQSGLPCILILFWGSWSDRHSRRKPCMLIPIIGEFFTSIGLILCTYFEKAPMEAAGISEALFPGLSGGWFTMLMGVFSYVADVTTKEERTLRIGIVNLFISLGVPFGMAFSGILLKQVGFYGVFSISASLQFFAFFYGLLCVKEPETKIETKKKILENDKSALADFFDKSHLVETFRVAFKHGPNQRRLRIIMLIVVVVVVDGPLHGEMSVFYLFTRYRFNWSEVEFSVFSTYAMVAGLIGTMFSVGLFSHKLKIEDSLIGVMSCMSKILSSFVYAFAKTDFQIYIGPIVEMLNGTSFIAMRSIASKLVCNDELGKVNSLFGVAEALVPLIYVPMYALVYASTLSVLPGAFFLLGGFLTMPAVGIFLWMYGKHKGDLKKRTSLEGKSDNEKCETMKSDGTININQYLIKGKRSSLPNIMSYARNGSMRRHQCYENALCTTSEENLPKISEEFNNYDNGVSKTINIVKEMPALNLEHCKL